MCLTYGSLTLINPKFLVLNHLIDSNQNRESKSFTTPCILILYNDHLQWKTFVVASLVNGKTFTVVSFMQHFIYLLMKNLLEVAIRN